MKVSGSTAGELEALRTSLGMTMLFIIVIFPNKDLGFGDFLST